MLNMRCWIGPVTGAAGCAAVEQVIKVLVDEPEHRELVVLVVTLIAFAELGLVWMVRTWIKHLEQGLARRQQDELDETLVSAIERRPRQLHSVDN